MYELMSEQIVRSRQREAHSRARQDRLARALRADRRARRAAKSARRAADRAFSAVGNASR